MSLIAQKPPFILLLDTLAMNFQVEEEVENDSTHLYLMSLIVALLLYIANESCPPAHLAR